MDDDERDAFLFGCTQITTAEAHLLPIGQRRLLRRALRQGALRDVAAALGLRAGARAFNRRMTASAAELAHHRLSPGPEELPSVALAWNR